MTSDKDKEKETQKAYLDTKSGKDAIRKAREKYDNAYPEKRRLQKRDYMRRKRKGDPNYGNE